MPRLRSWAFRRSNILQLRSESLQEIFALREILQSHQIRRQLRGVQTTSRGRVSLLLPERRRIFHHGQRDKWPPTRRSADLPTRKQQLEQIVAYPDFAKRGLRREHKKKKEYWVLSESQRWKKAMKIVCAPFNQYIIGKRRAPIIGFQGILSRIPKYRLVRKRMRWKLMRRTWFSLVNEDKKQYLQSALLHALKDSPLLAYDILHDLVEHQITVPRTVVQDVFTHAGMACLSWFPGRSNQKTKAVTIVFRRVLKIIQLVSPKVPFTLSHDLVLALANKLSRRQLKSLINTVLANPNANLTNWSMCHVVKRAVAFGLINLALKLLRQIPKENTGHEAVQWACIQMLRLELKLSKPRLYRIRLYLLHEILSMGLAPGDALRNVIIQVFMENNESEHAWAVFENTKNRGLLPTVGTFFALLQQAQPSSFSEVLKVIHTAKISGCIAPGVGFNALLMLERLQKSQKGIFDSPFQNALRLYIHFYDIQPLVDIGFLDNESRLKLPTAESPQAVPPIEVMAIMIRTFCQQYAGSLHLWNCYRFLMARAIGGDLYFARLTSKPWVFEYFMTGMKSKQELLGGCAQILQDMLDPSSLEKYVLTETASDSLRSASSGRNFAQELGAVRNSANDSKEKNHAGGVKISKPRSTTWNILLQALLNSRDLDSAEKLVELMQEEGFKPTLVTWNSLIGAFADSQKVDKVVSAIEEIERQNFEPDDSTRKNLTRIVDRKALIDALDRAQREKLS